MIVRRPRMTVNDPTIPPALPGLKRVSELNILGVHIPEWLEFIPHISHITITAVQSTYALRVLRAHGPWSEHGPNLWEVSRATAVVELTYACSAWWGYVDAVPNPKFSPQWKNLKSWLFAWRCFLYWHLPKAGFTTISSLKFFQWKPCTTSIAPACVEYTYVHTLCVSGFIISNWLSRIQPWEKNVNTQILQAIITSKNCTRVNWTAWCTMNYTVNLTIVYFVC